jgi:hypothetical protein
MALVLSAYVSEKSGLNLESTIWDTVASGIGRDTLDGLCWIACSRTMIWVGKEKGGRDRFVTYTHAVVWNWMGEQWINAYSDYNCIMFDLDDAPQTTVDI